MKKLAHKLAILWMTLLSLTGFAKAKSNKAVPDHKNKIAGPRVILLDEFEISAYHSN